MTRELYRETDDPRSDRSRSDRPSTDSLLADGQRAEGRQSDGPLSGRHVWQCNLGAPPSAVDGVRSAISTYAASAGRLGARVSILQSERGDGRQLAELRRALQLLSRRERPDLIHLHSAFRPQHDVISAMCRRVGVPYVYSPHSAFAPAALERGALGKSLYLALLERRSVRAAAVVMCLTEGEATEVQRVVRTRRTRVVANGFYDADDMPPPWQLPGTTPPVLVTLARYDVRQKGLDRMAEIAGHAPTLQFRVYGAPDVNSGTELDELRATKPDNFALEDPVFGQDKTTALARATMFLQPSRWEGLSMSLVEALAHGVPCAVSQYVDASLGLSEEGAAVVLPGDAREAAELLSSVVADDRQLAALSAAGREYARHRLSQQRLDEDLCELYRSAFLTDAR